jgi:hypothetical protein
MANNVTGTSNDNVVPGVKGENTGNGPAIHGESINGRGVEGMSTNNYGIRAHSDNLAGLRASSTKSRGVEGNSIIAEGVAGVSTSGVGIAGTSQTSVGVKGEGVTGVAGISQTGDGVSGFGRRGVLGVSIDFQGVKGKSTNNAGVVGESEKFVGVWGESKSDDQPGVFGKGKLAARFIGDVEVIGYLSLTNADFAEDFDVIELTESGEVMVLTETGILHQSTKPYDKKVVGVISGAGSYKPGIILDKQDNSDNRKPIAMMGKVYCKVDADVSPIETGDMLTTSNIPGHAMKAVDPLKAFGAVIGKALVSLNQGKGLIPILVVLQ